MITVKINLNNTNKIKDFVNAARSFESDINVRNERTLIDGKSVLGLFDLDLSRNVYADLISDDENEIFRFKTAMEAFS